MYYCYNFRDVHKSIVLQTTHINSDKVLEVFLDWQINWTPLLVCRLRKLSVTFKFGLSERQSEQHRVNHPAGAAKRQTSIIINTMIDYCNSQNITHICSIKQDNGRNLFCLNSTLMGLYMFCCKTGTRRLKSTSVDYNLKKKKPSKDLSKHLCFGPSSALQTHT